jgi:hypothetical protein
VIEELARELRAVGIGGRRRERILAEIADHLASDPDAALGDPRMLAAQFADELATSGARRATVASFAALSVVAAALVATQAALPNYPDIASGRSVVLAALSILFIVFGAQVAFVAGSLGALRALRLRRQPALPAAEVAVLRRRNAVALAAGAVTLAGIAVDAVNFSAELPGWWLLLAVTAAGAAMLPLAGAALAQARTSSLVVSIDGEAGGFGADLGPLAQPALIGAGAVAAVLLVTWQAESSFVEGAIRAAAEGVAFTAGYFALGRLLALR